MEIIIQPDVLEASRIAARIIARTVREKPHAVLGFATGNSPRQLYANLTELHSKENLDFSGVTAFNLDEYLGTAADHPASFHSYMKTLLFDKINIPNRRIHIPDGLAPDIPSYCRYYEASIRSAGGIDIQVLGIGSNGHIGFNEPTSSLTSRTRIKTLTEETRKEIAPGFGGMDKTPSHVITMGLGTIMDSRMCLLLAFGKKKAKAIAQTVEGPVTAWMPGTILQMHPRTMIIIDEDAASELKMADYYRWVHENKPEWQRF